MAISRLSCMTINIKGWESSFAIILIRYCKKCEHRIVTSLFYFSCQTFFVTHCKDIGTQKNLLWENPISQRFLAATLI